MPPRVIQIPSIQSPPRAVTSHVTSAATAMMNSSQRTAAKKMETFIGLARRWRPVAAGGLAGSGRAALGLGLLVRHPDPPPVGKLPAQVAGQAEGSQAGR